MDNQTIAGYLKELADFMELEGDDPFRIRAYRNAARTIENSRREFAELVAEHRDLSGFPGIGEHISRKIEEIVTTGRLKKLEEIRKKFPPHILDILTIEGIGPKRAKKLYTVLGIGSLEDLRNAAENHRISKIGGFGEALESKILKGIVLKKKQGRRFLFSEAEPFADLLEKYLGKEKSIERITLAGSYRRRKETVGDLDIVITSDNPPAAMKHFTSFPEIREIVSRGDTRSTVILQNDLQIDLRCVSNESYGAALHYLTGSKPHNIALRKMAMERGWKINEYGVFDAQMHRIAGARESQIYRLFGMDYIEPELRENRGELEAAATGTLPDLVTRETIRGELHCHSLLGGGHSPPEELLAKADRLGYRYLAIADRARYFTDISGDGRGKLEQYLDTLHSLGKKHGKVRLISGIEVEVLEDGSLELPDRALEPFELVVAALNRRYGLDRDAQTRRVLKALSHPRVAILSRVTGRIIGRRDGCQLDMERIADAAAQHGVWLEIDARPDRLDPDEIHVRSAKERGAGFVISSNARDAKELENIRFGINQARRAWLEKSDVGNARSLKHLEDFLGNKR